MFCFFLIFTFHLVQLTMQCNSNFLSNKNTKHGTLAWDLCMGPLHGTFALDLCMGPLHESFELVLCIGPLHGTLAWDVSMGPLHRTFALALEEATIG
jgi:hypothetical protein